MTERPAPPEDAAALVRLRLLRLLGDERFHPGELVGSERALAERFGVSRSLLRQAVDRLEDEGRVRRATGRTGGVFAHDGKVQRHLNTTMGVPEMVRRQGMRVATTVLRAELGVPGPDERRALRLGEGEQVVRVVRLRRVDDVPWSLDRSVLPARRYPGLLQHDLTESLYATLTARYGLELDRADETVEAVPATAEQARLLQVPAGAALLAIRRTAHDVDGAAVEHALDFFRADRTRVHLQKLGANWKRVARRERGG
ncbi:GntR family transcriptional regulator [Kineococcus terrestris]|uniref:GntR family transcriptional regulator n=1 Tax=Kineococcus terrestris TaxID=2044856 RepID=UPI0034DB1F8E